MRPPAAAGRYTGTLLCVDPDLNVSTALLAARVYPDKTQNDDAFVYVKQDFNTAAKAALGYT